MHCYITRSGQRVCKYAKAHRLSLLHQHGSDVSTHVVLKPAQCSHQLAALPTWFPKPHQKPQPTTPMISAATIPLCWAGVSSTTQYLQQQQQRWGDCCVLAAQNHLLHKSAHLLLALLEIPCTLQESLHQTKRLPRTLNALTVGAQRPALAAPCRLFSGLPTCATGSPGTQLRMQTGCPAGRRQGEAAMHMLTGSTATITRQGWRRRRTLWPLWCCHRRRQCQCLFIGSTSPESNPPLLAFVAPHPTSAADGPPPVSLLCPWPFPPLLPLLPSVASSSSPASPLVPPCCPLPLPYCPSWEACTL